MWGTYLLLGGSLDPEPDTQSPFFFPEDYEEGGPYRKGKGIKLITPRSEIVG